MSENLQISRDWIKNDFAEKGLRFEKQDVEGGFTITIWDRVNYKIIGVTVFKDEANFDTWMTAFYLGFVWGQFDGQNSGGKQQ